MEELRVIQDLCPKKIPLFQNRYPLYGCQSQFDRGVSNLSPSLPSGALRPLGLAMLGRDWPPAGENMSKKGGRDGDVSEKVLKMRWRAVFACQAIGGDSHRSALGGARDDDFGISGGRWVYDATSREAKMEIPADLQSKRGIRHGFPVIARRTVLCQELVKMQPTLQRDMH